MSFGRENISQIQYDLDNEKSEYQLKAVKLTMEGYRDEAKYYDLIIKVYSNISDMLDDTYDSDINTCIELFNKEYKNTRNSYLVKFHDLSNPAQSLLSGIYIETLDNLFEEVERKIRRCAE